MSDWFPFASSVAGGLLNTAAGFGSMALSQHYSKSLMDYQNQLYRENLKYQNDLQRSNLLSRASLEKSSLVNAGMNPLLMQNSGASANISPQASMPSASSSGSSMSPFDSVALSQGAAQVSLLKAQKANVEADTRLKTQHAEESSALTRKYGEEVKRVIHGYYTEVFGTNPTVMDVAKTIATKTGSYVGDILKFLVPSKVSGGLLSKVAKYLIDDSSPKVTNVEKMVQNFITNNK